MTTDLGGFVWLRAAELDGTVLNDTGRGNSESDEAGDESGELHYCGGGWIDWRCLCVYWVLMLKLESKLLGKKIVLDGWSGGLYTGSGLRLFSITA